MTNSKDQWEEFAKEAQFQAVGIAIKWIIKKALRLHQKQKERKTIKRFQYGPDGLIKKCIEPGSAEFAVPKPWMVCVSKSERARRQPRDSRGRFIKKYGPKKRKKKKQ